MAGRKPKSARTIAIEVLNQCEPKRNYAGPILKKLLCETEQKQRATDLVFGSIRNRRAIDTIIAAFSGRAIKRIPDKLLNIIRIGIYELVYVPETQEYSIVNEAVENAKVLVGQKQAGFVNAVLRQVTRHIKNRKIQLSQAETKSTLVQTPSIGCEFDTNFLPDPEQSLADYLSVTFSLPKWLVSDWLEEYGQEPTRQICLASNRKPGIYLRPNTLKTTAQELVDMLKRENIDSEIAAGTMIKIKSPRAIADLPGFTEGLFVIQDITASQPVRILNPQPNWTMLDLCAAPGVKTTQLAEATGDSATIIATDIDSRRLEMVKESIARLGIKSVRITATDNLQSITTETGPFDSILLDVPCSNTGVLAKRIEARYRIKPKVIEEMTKKQSELLNTAAAMIRPQGKICYSTCSIQKAENSELVRDFLQNKPNFKLESELLTLPSTQTFDHDGGYVAILCKLE